MAVALHLAGFHPEQDLGRKCYDRHKDNIYSPYSNNETEIKKGCIYITVFERRYI